MQGWVALGMVLCSGTARGEQYSPLYTLFNEFGEKSSAVYDPLREMVWTSVKDFGGVDENGSSHYLDVISHTDPNDPVCPRSLGMAFSQPSIRIHETEHMLSYQISKLSGTDDYNLEGLYFQNGNGLIFSNPRTRVTDFSNMIPSELREAPSPYQTYIVEQMKYPSLNRIGYLFNEWASYRSNILLNLQLEKAGTPESDADGHGSNFSPHFFGYLAIGLHYLRTAEPEALKDRQFKAAFALYAELTWQLMHEALRSPVFGKLDTIYGSRINKLMEFYRNSPRFAAVRNSLVDIYGKEWVAKLMQ